MKQQTILCLVAKMHTERKGTGKVLATGTYNMLKGVHAKILIKTKTL